MKTRKEDIDLTRVNNDTNGNPRYVVHFTQLVNDQDREKAKEGSSLESPAISKLYEMALKKARKIGGRKFHNKQYGGGVVFQSYNTPDLIKTILEAQKSNLK